MTRLTRRAALAALCLGGALAACSGGGHKAAAETGATTSASGTGSGTAPATQPAARVTIPWSRFDYDAARTGHSPSGLSATQVAKLKERRVGIPGTVDSSPIYLAGVRVRGRTRNLLVVTTTYGRTLGLDAVSGALLWTFSPSSYSSLAGTSQITTATPVADPSGRYVYASSPDGFIHKLRVTNGSEVRSGAWPASVTRNASHEKIASALNLDGRYVFVTTGGYIGDAPPYQGKVLSIDRTSGRVVHVFNSLCSNRRQIIDPKSCSAQESAIWGRAGAVVDPTTHNLYATSSNGPFDGSVNWADTVLRLSPGVGTLLAHYTPSNQKQLEDADGDLGSSSPALLPDPNGGSATRYLLQGGKDGVLRLLSASSSFSGVSGAAGRHLGGELQTLPLPGGDQTMFTAPAVLHRGGLTEVFVATGAGTAAYKLVGGRLRVAWQNGSGGTSPLLAGSLLWVYDPSGALNVYQPASGRLVRRFSVPGGHWNSPIVVGGRVYLPSGNANDHDAHGVLSIFHGG
jgi:PQQ-like domain